MLTFFSLSLSRCDFLYRLRAINRLIKWTEQTFPTNKNEELLPILEKCTVELQEDTKYQKDLRYLRVWIKYADACSDPSDVFKFLKANDIGQTHALFYECYASFLEMKKAYKLADEVYKRGVEMKAEPMSRLKMQYEGFTKRVRKREMKKQERGEVLEDQSQNYRQFGDKVTKTGRRIEAGLTSLRAQQATRGLGGGLRRQSGAPTIQGDRRASNNNNIMRPSNFEVFQDDDENGSRMTQNRGGSENVATNWKKLGTREETIKENAAKPSQWNGVSLTASKRKLAPGKTIDATIEVYEDTECLDAEMVQKALKTTKISEMPLRLRDRMDLKNDVKVNPVSAHEKAKLLSQSQMKKPSSAAMDCGPGKQVNLKETFEETAAREWRENHPEHEHYQQRMPHQSPIVVASASNAAASKGITSMDVDDEAASKRNEQWLPERPSTASKKESEHISQIDSCENEKSAQNSAAAVATTANEKTKPSAGARWTKDEGGFLQNSEPTMTFCTKEAWGDVMAMFSDRGGAKEEQQSDNEGTKSGSGSGYEGDASRGARTPKMKSTHAAQKATENPKEQEEDDGDDGFHIREDTVCLPANIVVEKEETNNNMNNNKSDFDFDIREDTECIPSINEIKKGALQQKKGFGSPIAVLKERNIEDAAPARNENDDENKVPTEAKASLNDNTVKRFSSPKGEENTVLMAVPAVNDDKDNTLNNVTIIEENVGARNYEKGLKITKEKEKEEIHLVDPFANIDNLLENAKIESSSVNVSVSNDPSELSSLVAAGKRVSGAKGAIGKKAGEGVEVTIGDKEYVLRSKAGEGAYACVYEAEGKETLKPEDVPPVFAIKVESKKLASWEFLISSRLCERLPRGAPRDIVVPSHLRLLFDAKSQTHTTGALVMKFGDHGTLQDVVNFYKLTESKTGAMDEKLAMYYSIELLRLLEWTHESDVLHCDVKPDNLLLRNGGERWLDWDSSRPGSWKKKGLALIDFGRAIDLRDYEANTQFVGNAGTESFSCPEMRENKSWVYQSDCFAIAATIHVMLHGEYMETITDRKTGKYAPKLALKRYWNQDVWKLVFEKLMNHPTTESTAEKPNLRAIREVLEEALDANGTGGSLVKSLLVKQTIGMFELIKEGKAV